MLLLLMYDNIQFSSFLCPLWILGKEELIPIFSGTPLFKDEEHNSLSLYIYEETYDKIDHDKIYVLVHHPDIEFEEICEIVQDLDRTLSKPKEECSLFEIEHYHLTFDIFNKIDRTIIQ